MTSYSSAITSKNITGTYSPVLKLNYDYYLNNYGTTTIEHMAVELWDGATWHTLKDYDNSADQSIPWTSESIDISAYNAITFKIRFRAHGDDSSNINWWDIDNIHVVASGVPGPNYCVIGYNFYLNNVLDGFTPDTFYHIPHTHVLYGHTYQACVLAVYGSGYSTKSCYTFTSHFLYPPRNIHADSVEDAAYITWQKPTISDAMNADVPLHVPAFTGVIDHTPGITGLAPVTPGQTPANSKLNPMGSVAFAVDASTSHFINFDINNVAGMTVVAASPSGFVHTLVFPFNELTYCYLTKDLDPNLYKVIKATGVVTEPMDQVFIPLILQHRVIPTWDLTPQAEHL
jgi:hypothetical protein